MCVFVLVSSPCDSAASEMDQADPLNGSAGFGDVQQYHGAAAQSVEQASAAPAFDENSLITDAASLLDPDFIAQLGAELGFTDGFVNASQSQVPALDAAQYQPKMVLAPVKSDSEGAKRRRLRQLQLDAALARFQSAAPSMPVELNENKSASGKGAGDANAPLERRRRDGESSDASSDGERDSATANNREVCCDRLSTALRSLADPCDDLRVDFYVFLIVFTISFVGVLLYAYFYSQESESDDDEPLAMQRERIAHSKRATEAAGMHEPASLTMCLMFPSCSLALFYYCFLCLNYSSGNSKPGGRSRLA